MPSQTKNCGAGANAAGGNTNWTNPNNVAVSGQSASASLIAGASTNSLNTTSYGFSIPSNATIKGIQVVFSRSDSSGNLSTDDEFFFLLKAGSPVGTDHSAGAGSPWPVNSTSVTYGSASDLWGTTWAPSDINASNFGFSLATIETSGVNPSSPAVFAFVSITVTYTVPAGEVSCQALFGF